MTVQAGGYRTESEAKLREIGTKAKEFFRTTDEMRRFASALAAVGVMGTVENATSGVGAFEDLVADLSAAQAARP